MIDNIHIQIEEQIPNELFGLSLSNSHKSKFRSPSLLIYNAQKYYCHFEKKNTTNPSLEIFHCTTGRCRASSFLENFSIQNKNNENILEYLDIDINLFGFIDPVLIISCNSNCLYKYKKNSILYSFGALSFSTTDDDRITRFILELSEIIHIYVIINKIHSDLEEIVISPFENSQNKNQ